MASTKTTGDEYRNYQDDRNAKSGETVYTTANGVPMSHPYETQRIGENGPLLLQGFHLIDILSHFDRERIPERVVHAKGSGAHGVYKTTESLDDLCLADMFQKGKECLATVRFSTVGGKSGSHDCARDPRGFSVKFKTDEGNWELVANNTPVFFLRDPAKFPHFIHTQKRDPATHLTGADDSTMFWDYLSQNPESIHQLVNKKGDWVYAQFHMTSQQGTRFLTQEEAATKSPDHSEGFWSLEVQTITAKEAEDLWEKQKINVFDLTHIWPHKQPPLRKIGEFTLNENAKNYFAEIEQVAFNPAHMVPGIEPSADPVLQSHLFSYPDAHRHRVGVNYQQLPVNAPRVNYCMANFQRDGSMSFFNQGSRPNYLSSIEPIHFRERTEKVFDGKAKEIFIKNVSGHMANCKEEIIKRQIAIFREVSDDLATRLEKATGVKGYDGISELAFNGTHNGMTKDKSRRVANGMKGVTLSVSENNGAPTSGSHGELSKGIAAH
ncbi:catalase-like domain-containing protein [Halenospora varia]|nr:catalase-like domain-containing protein [Halenospora varia]